ncbi:MAG: hypothetical protein RIT14_1315, partial [Pseudomonadota bacterium]
MAKDGPLFRAGLAELRQARRAQSGLFWAAVLFSIFVNLLLLTGPLYMLQVYDRVLGSQSESTLIALSLLVTFLFVAMGLLDHARARILARIGARLQDRLDRRVFSAALRRLMAMPDDPVALSAQRDVEAIRSFWTSPVLPALIDLPWTPMFLAAIFVFHPMLGWVSVAGGTVIVGIALLNQQQTRLPILRTSQASLQADRMAELLKAEAETIRALGMTTPAFARWHMARGAALGQSIAASDKGGIYATLSKTFRLFLQSAMLGLGAWLVLRGQMTGGAMIAGSILMGRALQPVEQAVAQWAVITRARDAHSHLAELLSAIPSESPRTALPRPAAMIDVSGLTVIPPGEA